MQCQDFQPVQRPIETKASFYNPCHALRGVATQLKHVIKKIKEWIANFIFPRKEIIEETLAQEAWVHFKGHPQHSQIVTMLKNRVTISFSSKVATITKASILELQSPNYAEVQQEVCTFLRARGITQIGIEQ